MGARKLLAVLMLQAVEDWIRLASLIDIAAIEEDGQIVAIIQEAGEPTDIHRQVARRCGYGEDCHREMLDFFRSDWCDGICLELGIDYGAMLDRLEVNQ